MPQFVNEQHARLERGLPRAADSSGARVLIIAGGRAGVGCSTLALQLARELALDAQRVVLIDADTAGPSIAKRCGLPLGLGIAEVLAGRKTIHEALQRGPAGMQVLAGAAGNAAPDERSVSRLVRQLRTLSPHADWLLVDAGHTANELAGRLWSIADTLLVVTAADAVAVMDTYAMLKTLHARQMVRRTPGLVVNGAGEPAVAADVFRRIDQSCQRFLNLSLNFAGTLSLEPATRVDGERNEPPLAAGVAQLCKHLLETSAAVSRPTQAA